MLNEANAGVVDKIRKLLALGTSSNEHEAAAAIAKAQALMEQYDLVMADVENALKADDSIVETGGKVLVRKGKPEAWREQVARAVASTSDVWLSYRTVAVKKVNPKYPEWGEVTSHRERSHYFIGMKRDVELAGYSLDFLLGELERLANEYTKTRWDAIWRLAEERGWTHQTAESYWVKYLGEPHPLKSRKYWLEGAADGVAGALAMAKRERRDASDATNALVVMKESAIRDWYWRKNYGQSYEEFKAEQAARAANDKTVAKPETDAQRRRRAEREQRQGERASERAHRAYQREYWNRDHTAYDAGFKTGQTVGVRPGVEAGKAQRKVEG